MANSGPYKKGGESPSAGSRKTPRTSAVKSSGKSPVKSESKGARKPPVKTGGQDFRKGPAKRAGEGPGKGPAKAEGKDYRRGPAKRAGEGPGKGPAKAEGKDYRRGPAKRAGEGPGKGPAKAEGKDFRRGPAKPAGTGSGKTSEGDHIKKPFQKEEVRLNKFIAASGICSRREADRLIAAGLVSVNGKSVTTLGTKVTTEDDIRYNGQRIKNEKKVYLVLNKPKDFVTTTNDPKERKTVMTLIKNACPERIYPVGRLDRNTTGVLLFTNDGEMAKKLTHPGYNKKKIYHVFLDKAVKDGDLHSLANGITLEDGFIQPDAISYASAENKKEIGLEIHSGKNRIVRRMFESLGYRVNKLDRVYFAGLTKKNLQRGKWRFLTEREIRNLRMNTYE